MARDGSVDNVRGTKQVDREGDMWEWGNETMQNRENWFLNTGTSTKHFSLQ